MSTRFGEPWHRRLLEIQGLLHELTNLVDGLTRPGYDNDDVRRWAIHRLWIALGTEAGLYRIDPHAPDNDHTLWATLYRLRNDLAHRSLPEIDEDTVWRMSALRLASIDRVVSGLTG